MPLPLQDHPPRKIDMPRTQPDCIDRSIEVLFSRDFVESEHLLTDAHSEGGVTTLPRLDLHSRSQSALLQSASPELDAMLGKADSDDRIATQVIETSSGPVWLCGNAVMCGCPDCEAPVSVRTWLMIADCWYCGGAIELDYEQQRAAEQLVRNIATPELAQLAPSENVPSPAALKTVPVEPDDEEEEVELSIDAGPPRRRFVQVLRQSMSTLPAWLISTLVHLILLLILALILIPQSQRPRMITLSTAVGPMIEEGGVHVEIQPEDPLEYDAPMPPVNPKVQRALKRIELAANQDARELLIDTDPRAELPELSKVRESVTTGPKNYSTALRDPRLRHEIVEKEGGTRLSEAAVSRGLAWLASVQNRDGSWSLSDYWNHEDASNKGDAAATSLALLPFLGAGQTHEYGKYKDTVAKGLKWLIDHQRSNGDLRYGMQNEAGMYGHGQASIVLIEALAMTGDEAFRKPAQQAINFIEKAQHREGGWRYKPGQEGDTSVLGWQLMALQSARGANAGLQMDDATLELADQFLDIVGRSYPEPSDRLKRKSPARAARMQIFADAPSRTLYRYQKADAEPKAVMTAEAILCRMYLGWKRDDARMTYAVNWLLKHALPNPDKMNLYYYYYATQVMHHYGGRQWEIWNNHTRDLLVVTQVQGGRYPGSWKPEHFRWGREGGRIYTTAMAVCTLEVYYRHLPLFKQLELE